MEPTAAQRAELETSDPAVLLDKLRYAGPVLTENAIRAGLASLRTTMSDSCLTGYSVRTGVTREIR